MVTERNRHPVICLQESQVQKWHGNGKSLDGRLISWLASPQRQAALRVLVSLAMSVRMKLVGIYKL